MGTTSTVLRPFTTCKLSSELRISHHSQEPALPANSFLHCRGLLRIAELTDPSVCPLRNVLYTSLSRV
jgi:hypothetical protein